MEIWVFLFLLDLVTDAAMSMGIQIFFETQLLIVGICEMRLMNHMVLSS